MENFIVVTLDNGEFVRINLNHIVFYRARETAGAYISLTGSNSFEVTQKPEQLDRMIEEANNP